MSKQPISYLQTDPRWKNIDYSAKGESCNIGNAGCGPTSAAMIIATYIDPNVTPATAAAWALKNGYKAANQGTYYSFFQAYGKLHGLTWKQANGINLRSLKPVDALPFHNKALQAIKDGKPVIACMGPGNWTSSGHYVLWWGNEGTDVLINDPASTAPGRIRNKLALLQSQVKYYFICDIPKQQEEDAEVIEVVNMNVNGVMKPIRRILKDDRNFVELNTLKELGIIELSYDEKTKLVTITPRK